MLTNIRYILLTALRDFLFLGLIVAIMLGVAISATLGGTAMVEKDAMSVVYSGASARVILIFGLTIFVAFHIRQAFDQKEIDVLLSRPLSRFKIMLSYWLGFSLIGSLLTLAVLTVLSFLPLANLTGYAYWGASLLLESWIMVAVTLFAAFTLSSAVGAVLASIGIYVIGRMMAFFVATSDSAFLFKTPWLNDLLEFIINGVSMVMPRLDVFTQSDWLIHGVSRMGDLELAVRQALIYIPLLLIAATLDFLRKEF